MAKLERMQCEFIGRFVISGNTATPKYSLERYWGKWSPLRYLTGKDGNISFYLQKNGESAATEYRLQGKNSCNVTGLWPSGNNVYFGQPPRGATYSLRMKSNPFVGHEMDGFVFIFDEAKQWFEMLVFEGQRLNVGRIADNVAIGKCADTLDYLRNSSVLYSDFLARLNDVRQN